MKKIQDALGEKFSTTVKCLGTFLGGISLGLGKFSIKKNAAFRCTVTELKACKSITINSDWFYYH